MDVATLIQELGSTPSATARATGLSRMTVQRVRDGVTSPTLSTLREFALAAGLDLDLSLVPASDPAAAVAARVIADPATPDLTELHDWDILAQDSGAQAVIGWVARLTRQIETQDQLLPLAGRYAAPQHRTGARFFAPKAGVTQDRIIDVVSSAIAPLGGALSGVAAARAYLGHAPDPGPVIAWAPDVDAAAERLAETLVEVREYQAAGVMVAPTMQAYFVDMLTSPTVRHPVVAPIQAALDLYGLGYDALADEITAGW